MELSMDQALKAKSEFCEDQLDTWGRSHDVIDAGGVLTIACHGRAVKSGWWIDAETGEDVRTWEKKYFLCWVATKLALIHSEVSEGLEGHRKNLMDDHLPHRKMLEVELADAVIRTFDLAGGLGFDLGSAIAEKLAFNAQRPDHKIDHRVAEGGKAY
jgi:NTP pyrophosphatase (non-canonical NTP hydrolase)